MKTVKCILRIADSKGGPAAEFEFATAACARQAIKLFEVSTTERQIPLLLEELEAGQRQKSNRGQNA